MLRKIYLEAVKETNALLAHDRHEETIQVCKSRSYEMDGINLGSPRKVPEL
jgi:hypothetical protein